MTLDHEPDLPDLKKRDFIRLYFDAFRKRVHRLSALDTTGFPDEAFTLCIIYIDRLASGHYGGNQKNRNFHRVLTELGGDSLFKLLHPTDVLTVAQKAAGHELPEFKAAVERGGNRLLDEAVAIAVFKRTAPTVEANRHFTENIWRASIASIVYRRCRNPEVHGPGSGGLSLDEIVHNGTRGIRIDFANLYPALLSILSKIAALSNETGHWYGNPFFISTLSNSR